MSQNELQGKNIKALREEAKLTPTAFALMIGELANSKTPITKATINDWETGISYPDPEVAAKMCELFGVSMDYILGNVTTKGITAEEDVTYNGIEYRVTQFPLTKC